MNLNNLKITNVGYDLANGFFWVEYDNKKFIQCRLMKRRDGNGFKKAINFDDPGIVLNAWVSTDDDYEFVYTTIKREARNAGVRIINP